MYFYYGVISNYIDITNIVLDKCIINNIIVIPHNDYIRTKLFGDPAYRQYKHIKVIFDDLTEKIYNFGDNVIFKYNYGLSIKYKTILFMNARDEINLVEWTLHHLLLGFDYIYIFDHKSIIPISHTLQKFNSRVIIERREDDALKLKSIFITDAIKIAQDMNIDWMLYLDADEYVILNEDDNIDTYNINDFLSKYHLFDSIYINWCMFGSNNIDITYSTTLLDTYTKSDDKFDKHIKSFVRPSKIAPNLKLYSHSYDLIDNHYRCNINYDIIPIDNLPCFNHLHISQHPLSTPTSSNSINNVYIAHYYIQSLESYLKRKINRNRDDLTNSNNRHSIINVEHYGIHNIYNNIENLVPYNKYFHNINLLLPYYS